MLKTINSIVNYTYFKNCENVGDDLLVNFMAELLSNSSQLQLVLYLAYL